MFDLAWDVHELEELISMGRKLRVKMATLCDKLKGDALSRKEDEVSLRITDLQSELTKFVKILTRHQRTAATHCLVIMISAEERNRKPYALPVQCLPYKGLKDSEIRDIGNKVIEDMHKRGMKVAGMFYDYIYAN